MKTLDISHKQVLIHWNTLEQMMHCSNEAQEYLIEIAKHTFSTLGTKIADRLQMYDVIRKDSYFEYAPLRASAWKGSADCLFGLGVEWITVQRILYPTLDEYCRAYFYSPYRANNLDSEGKTNLIAGRVAPPQGITMSLDLPRKGYFFQVPLPSITVDDFSDAPKLSRYFSSAISPIIEWYLKNEEVLLKAAS